MNTKTKIIRDIIITSIAIVGVMDIANSQEKIQFGTYQDIKLGFGQDEEHGNVSPTLDLLLNVSLEGKQFKYYYFSIVPFFEMANLHSGDFKRYGVSLMWNFNRLLIERLEIGIGTGFGVIHRPESYASYSFTADLSCLIAKGISLGLKNEWVRRSELKTPKLAYNLSIGIKLNLIKL